MFFKPGKGVALEAIPRSVSTRPLIKFGAKNRKPKQNAILLGADFGCGGGGGFLSTRRRLIIADMLYCTFTHGI